MSKRKSENGGPPDPVIEATGIVKQFPGVRALQDVSFSVLPGEVHALVGENGAGKSTLIKVLTGVHRPDAGTLRIAGEPAAFNGPVDAQRAGVQAIHQEIGLVPQLSVARNLLLGREPRTRLGLIDAHRLRARASELLEPYGVHVDVRRPLRTLGIGTQQMVALARAVSVNARMVVMDEPTSSLEPREVRTLFDVIGRLREKQIAIVYVSHRMDELFRICDRVTVLRDGQHVHTGELAELDRLRLVSLMLGRDMAEVRTGLTRFSSDHGDDGADAQAPILEVCELRRRHVLSGVSLTVRPGEVVGLGGLLGSGRTETVKAVAGGLGVDSGEVVVAGRSLGRPTTSAAARAGIALLPEDRKAEGIVPTLSIRDNIALAALPRLSRLGLVSDARIDRIVETFMRRLRVKASSVHQRVGELSGGNQQKVVLARWLATSPKVLLLDEPTRGIDVGAKAEVQALIDELAEEGLGVVLISSELEELVEGSDRVVVLREGSVIGELAGADVSEAGVMAAIAAVGADGASSGAASSGAALREAVPPDAAVEEWGPVGTGPDGKED